MHQGQSAIVQVVCAQCEVGEHAPLAHAHRGDVGGESGTAGGAASSVRYPAVHRGRLR